MLMYLALKDIRMILCRTALVAFAFLATSLTIILLFDPAPQPPAPVLRKMERVAHAGGGFNGQVYTNSLQALDHNASRYALFELDFCFTADGAIVCMHDWEHTVTDKYGVHLKGPPSLQEFKALIGRTTGITPCTLDDLLAWLAKNPGKRIVTDAKERNYEILQEIARRYPSYASTFIPQIYSPAEEEGVRRLGYRDIILTLYRCTERTTSILSEVRDRRFYAVTMNLYRVPPLAGPLRKLGVPTYVHTINEEAEWQRLKALGISEIYTDFLSPEQTSIQSSPHHR